MSPPVLRLLALALALALAPAASVADAPLAVARAQVLERLPHDPTAFTEGFFAKDGAFYESTGEVGRSFIRRIDPATGKVLRQVAVPPPHFGEGIAAVGDQIVSLTWKDGLGFRWRARDFRRLGTFRYAGEGWALASDGALLVMSDGTATLRVLDPKDLAVRRTIAVTLRGEPLPDLNEIEIVDGEILANVWHADAIVRIDPASGAVKGLIDLSALTREVAAPDPEAVPNGIAWDKARRRLYVTGKLWPTVFRIAWPVGEGRREARPHPIVTPGLTQGPLLLLSLRMDEHRGGWVYIMADRYRGTMYVGVTAHLNARAFQHRTGEGAEFCRKYGVTRLVCAEHGDSIHDCIAHEKRLKKWRREWKIALIERGNPNWIDLFGQLA